MKIIEKKYWKSYRLQVFHASTNFSLHSTLINEFTFGECKNLTEVKYDQDSKIEEIRKCAFNKSTNETISIPSQVTKICDCPFAFRHQLHKVKISSDSKLNTIEEYAFAEIAIKKFYFPSQVTILCESVFHNCSQLQTVVLSNESKLENIEVGSFDHFSIEYIIL